MAQKKTVSRSKRRRRRRKVKLILTLLCIIAVMILVCFSIFAIFKVKTIQVTGNQHTSTESVEQWILEGKYSDNSLYVLWKYNKKTTKQLPSVESTKITLKSPWVVKVKVTEKQLVGRIVSEDQNIYFDKDGIACFKNETVWEEVPIVEGLELDVTQVVLGKPIPAAEQSVFANIYNIMTLLEKNQLIPDKIVCEGKNITLYFGSVKAALGESNYEDKVVQIPPILEKIETQYTGQSGTLHLENYDITNSAVRFVPDTSLTE